MGHKGSKDGKKPAGKGGKGKGGKSKVIQVLVAGAAQSGKSTFFKQLHLIHFNSFSEEQNSEVFKTLRSNTILGFKELLEASESMKRIKFSEKAKDHVDFFKQKNPFDEFDDPTVKHAKALWDDKTFKKLWGARDTIATLSILHLDYCLEHVDRLSKDGSPSHDDVLLARKRTTGTNEITFEFKGKEFRFVDVGGQRSERRHWDQVIEKPAAVVFFVALSDWNLPTVGGKMTKMEESLQIWEEVITMEAFQASFFILMLNKVDVFKDKLKRIDFKESYPQYSGDAKNADEAATYLRGLFLSKFPADHSDSVQTHVTCALDTEQMKTVFGAMQTAMLERLMSDFGMI
jgi:GTPase SAR1 family protein